MDRINATGRDGIVHEGLFNSHTGSFIDVACDAGRYAVAVPYQKAMADTVGTDAALTCPGCTAAISGEAPHPADTARRIADAVLADADRRGFLPPLDDEGLRLAFVRIAPGVDDELRPVFDRLARGVYDPDNNFRSEPLYPLIRQHLDDDLTARAQAVPEGTPKVLIRYTRFTGGNLQVPIGVGDRLVKNGLASGHWDRFTVLVVERSGIIAQSDDGWTCHFNQDEVRRFFAYKLDRAPQPVSA